jgi:hypothetical protein
MRKFLLLWLSYPDKISLTRHAPENLDVCIGFLLDNCDEPSMVGRTKNMNSSSLSRGDSLNP